MNNSNSIHPARRNQLFGGLALIGMGLLFLLAQFVQIENFGDLVLPTLAVIFLAWGLLTRNPGLLVPGGILSGIALGTYLVTNPLADMPDKTQGGYFLLAFAGGWALITVLSLLIGHRQFWPLIPGGIMLVIGGALVAGGTTLDVFLNLLRLWPLALIAGGVLTLWKYFRRNAA